MKKQLTYGVIVGSRGFFPHHLAKEGREEIIKVLDANGYKAIVLSPEQTQHGAVQTPDDARHCAELFKKHREEIDGIIITLPNFGEERTIVDAIRLSGSEGSGAGAGNARPHGDDEDLAPARQFLRQDVGVQQPDAVRHSLFADGAAYRLAELGGVQEGPGVVLGGMPGGERLQESAYRCDRRAAGGVQYRSLQRETAGAVLAFRWRRWICRRFWGALRG